MNLDLLTADGQTCYTLARAETRIDPASECPIFLVDLKIELPGRAAAESLSQSMPGLAESFDLAGDDYKAKMTVRRTESVRVAIRATQRPAGSPPALLADGEAILDGRAELVAMIGSLTAKSRNVIARLRFRGHGPMIAAYLADNLARTVLVAWTQPSQQLDMFAPPAVRDGEDQPEVQPTRPSVTMGDIVAATLADGAQIVGRVFEVDGAGIQVAEAGRVYTVQPADVISRFTLASDDGTTAALTDYADRCDGLEIPVSWSALVDVLRDSLDPDQAEITVSQEQVIRAVETLIQPSAPAQPDGDDGDDDGDDDQPQQVIPIAGRRKPAAKARA